MSLKATELKAIVVMADLQEQDRAITSDQCMSVGHFDYACFRNRDGKGRTYHDSAPAMLNFVVRFNAIAKAKQFYQLIQNNDPGTLSFLFNATFSSDRYLDDYAGAMVVKGFIVDIQEDFHSKVSSVQEDKQMIARVRMQIHSIFYKSGNTTKELSFVQ